MGHSPPGLPPIPVLWVKSWFCVSFKSKLQGRESGPSPAETEDHEIADRHLGYRGDSGGPRIWSSEKLDGYARVERDKGIAY